MKEFILILLLFAGGLIAVLSGVIYLDSRNDSKIVSLYIEQKYKLTECQEENKKLKEELGVFLPKEFNTE
jgi:hypothetical protein